VTGPVVPFPLAPDALVRHLVARATDDLVDIRDGEVPLSGCLLQAITERLNDAMAVLDEWASDPWWWEEVS
jgi:hypothetical protein